MYFSRRDTPSRVMTACSKHHTSSQSRYKGSDDGVICMSDPLIVYSGTAMQRTTVATYQNLFVVLPSKLGQGV